MIYLIYTVMLLVSMVFINLSHPIALGLCLIIHTLLIGVASGILVSNFWFSYILFLVFLGGVLVLFIYMTSLASNEKFMFSWADFLLFTGLGVTLIFAVLFLMSPTSEILYHEGWDFSYSGFSVSTDMMMKLYSNESYLITLFLIFYLLYALVVCANLVGGYPGALRNFN